MVSRSSYLTLSDVPRFDARRYGVRADGVTDDLAALSTAIAAVNTAGGGILELPAGTILLAPSGTTTYVLWKSNVWITGCGWATKLKVKNDSGNFETLFASGSLGATAISNVALSDLVIDMNPSGNTTGTAAVASGQYQYAVKLLNATGVRIRNVRFAPCCGVNTVTINGSACSDAKVESCYFNFVPKTSPAAYDNTAVYVEADDFQVTDCDFVATIGSGARGAIEAHDAVGEANDNRVLGFTTGISLVTTFGTQPVTNSLSACDNIIRDCNGGIRVYATTGGTMIGAKIADNEIYVAQVQHNQSASCLGIGVEWDASATGSVQDLEITNNLIVFEDEGAGRSVSNEYLHRGINLTPQGNTSTGVTCTGNIVRRSPGPGIRVAGTQSGSSITDARITDNILVDCGQNVGIVIGSGAYRSAILIEGTMTDVLIDDNTIRDTGASALEGKHAINNLGATTFTNVVIGRNNRITTASAINLPITGCSIANISTGEGNVSTDRGDNSVTLVTGVDAEVQRFATNLTGNKTVTLSSTNAYNGCRFRVVRTGLGAFNLDVGGLKTITGALAAFVDVVRDDGAWRLAGYGTL